MQTIDRRVYFLRYLADWQPLPGIQTTFVHFAYDMFGSVLWDCEYAAITHPEGTRVCVREPAPPQWRACVYEVIGKYLSLPMPEMSAAEIELLQWFPAGYTLWEFAAYWPHELPEVSANWKRLNYYTGLYSWQPESIEYIHPELDRPLVAEEHAAIQANHSAAVERLTEFLYSFELEEDARYTTEIGPLLYDIRGLNREVPIQTYRSLRLVKRWVYPNIITWKE